MRKYLLYIIICVVVTALVGCNGGTERQRAARPSDTLYTVERAMEVYDYQPERALQIIDSAVIVGNLSEVWSDVYRMRVYGQTHMRATVDSLLHGPEGVGYDSVRAIGERLLRHDSVRVSAPMRQDVLEMLVNAARQQEDTVRYLQRSRELVEVCHEQGCETEALRTVAEIGFIRCLTGEADQGLATLDSVIGLLDGGQRHFNELDASIIAMKRKINALASLDRSMETLPQARRIIALLDDYEQHPDDYHDGTYREPAKADQRADYIHFYRTQAQGFITAAYTALGERRNMTEAYEQIERSVRETTAREHIARYRALEQQMQKEMQLAEAESRERIMLLTVIALAIGLLLLLLFALYSHRQQRRIQEKNHALVRLIEQQTKRQPAAPRTADDGACVELFRRIDSRIRSERLYAQPDLGRRDICTLFGIRRDTLNQLLADHTDGLSFPAYINGLRMAEACRLLREQPQMTVTAVAETVGLTVRNFRKLFAEQYGITPTEFRMEQ